MSTKPTVSSNIDTDSQNPHSACDVSSVGVEELKNLLNQLEILSGVPQSLTFPERQDEIWKLCTHIALYEKTFFDDIRILFLNLACDILPIKDKSNGHKVIDTWNEVYTKIINDYPNFKKNNLFMTIYSYLIESWYMLSRIQIMKISTSTSTKIEDICLYLAVYWDGDTEVRHNFLYLSYLFTNNHNVSNITKIWNYISSYVKNYPHPPTNESYDKFVIKNWCLQLYSAMYTYQSNPNPQMRNQNTRNDQKSTTIRHTTNTPHAIHHTTSQHPPQNSGRGLPVWHVQNNPAYPQHQPRNSGYANPVWYQGRHGRSTNHTQNHAYPGYHTFTDAPGVYRNPKNAGAYTEFGDKKRYAFFSELSTSDPTDSTTQSDQSENSATVETV